MAKILIQEEFYMKKVLLLTLCACLLLGATCIPIVATQEQSVTTDTTATDASTQQTEQESGSQTTMPLSASYTFINTSLGYASGSLSINMPEQSNATSYAMYWGDAAGVPLKDFKPFLTGDITAQTVYASTVEAFSFPAEAKTMLLYTYSEQFGQSASPYKIDLSNYTLPETGKKLSEIVVVSDLHIGSGKTADTHLITMLKDVKNISPDAAGIIVVGDAVDAADEQYYVQLEQLCANVAGAPTLYCGIGDRSYLTKGSYTYDAANHAANLQTFLSHLNHPFGVKPDKPYYSYTLGGVLMVFIGADSYQNGNAVYSQEQLTWLSGIVDNADKYEPIFVFMHEPLPNTVSGSFSSQGYGNVQNPQDIKQVFQGHDNLVVFSGHTQWQLEANNTMGYLNAGSRIFNVGGVAHLWDDVDGAGFEVAGNQGLYITVYEKAVLIRGRDFATGEWIPNAFYMFSTKPLPVQTQPIPSAPKPSTTTKPAATEEETEPADETGVRDLIPPLCILGCMTVIVFIFVFRKPKDQE